MKFRRLFELLIGMFPGSAIPEGVSNDVPPHVQAGGIACVRRVRRVGMIWLAFFAVWSSESMQYAPYTTSSDTEFWRGTASKASMNFYNNEHDRVRRHLFVVPFRCFESRTLAA